MIRLKNEAATPVYRVSFSEDKGGLKGAVDIAVSTHVLDAEIYRPLTAFLGGTYPQKADAAAYAPKAAEALSGFQAEGFVAENRRISGFLNENPRSVAANEDAAVLLGAFALRENSGAFWNPLPVCARATAHLAYAEFLTGKPSDSADALLADLLIGLMADTKARCQRQIEELQKFASARSVLSHWAAATRYRNSRDWRVPLDPSGATLLEKIEKYRAWCDAGGTGPAMADLLKTKPEEIPDWSRITLETSWSVDAGHRFTPGFLAAELQEAAKVLERPIPGSAVEAKAFVAALNMRPVPVVSKDSDGKWKLDVIDPPMWAQNAQRHICHAIFETWYFLAEMWGVPEEAQGFWTEMKGAFSEMDLFPAVALLRYQSVPETRPYVPALDRLFKEQPELVPDVVWYRAGAPRYSDLFPDVRREAAAWFDPPILTGTAYRYPSRGKQLTNFQHPTLEQLKPIYAVAPLQQGVVADYLAAKFKGAASESDLRAVAGPLLDYCMPVVREAAKRAGRDFALREKLLKTMADIDPDSAVELAGFYQKQKQPEKAAAAFQLYVDKASDRVSVSNQCRWLVNYYFDHGQSEEALEVAKMAAEVYSFDGLETYALLLERMHRLPDAEQAYQNIAERYEDAAPLYLFYKRNTGDPGLAAKAGKMEVGVFPSGIKDVTVASFSGRPKSGVLIEEENSLLRDCGLKSGDIVVAFDRRQVDTFEQYMFIRSLSDSPSFRLIAYHDGEYREVQVSIPERRFGVKMVTLK